MGFIGLFYPWGLILVVLALIHYARRRPEGYWLWIIIFGGGLGALVYLLVEAIPDLGLLRDSFKTFPRRKRIRELETAILDNPAPGNHEELGDLYLDEKKYQLARDHFDKAITSRSGPHPYYGRAQAECELGDFAAARTDLEKVIALEPGHDFNRAIGLLAWAEARTGDAARADSDFQKALASSSTSETLLHYGEFLATQGRAAEARECAQRVLNKKATLPSYLKRRERHWFRKAAALLKQLRSAPASA